MANIKCNVTECGFNNSVECAAPMIHVDRNSTKSAGTSEHTKCETFKPKK
ncbi:MAG: DUF1540 domain-containing protein [Firmicutes bacterium]|nr:DUF1540 domain-containing protein [Bacillota bacterium]